MKHLRIRCDNSIQAITSGINMLERESVDPARLEYIINSMKRNLAGLQLDLKLLIKKNSDPKLLTLF